MNASIQLGRPFGVPIGLHWSVLVLAALATWSLAGTFATAVPGYPEGTYWTTALLTVLLYGVSLVAHELAHAVVARRHGVPVRRITLWALGGLAELERQPDTAGAELRIAAAGPAASFVAGGVLVGMSWLASALSEAQVLVTALAWLGLVNVVLAAFNLLPARPLDGGRVLTALLWWRSGDRERATIRATGVAIVIGWMLVFVGTWQLVEGGVDGLWLTFVAWFVIVGARSERTVLQWRRKMKGRTARDVMSPPPPSLPGWISVAEAVQHDRPGDRAPQWLVRRFDGSVAGTVSGLALRRAARSAGLLPVGHLTQPLGDAGVVGPEEQLDAVVGERPVTLPLLVVDHGQVLGAVTAADLHRDPRPPSPWPPPGPTPVADPQWDLRP